MQLQSAHPQMSHHRNPVTYILAASNPSFICTGFVVSGNSVASRMDVLCCIKVGRVETGRAFETVLPHACVCPHCAVSSIRNIASV